MKKVYTHKCHASALQKLSVSLTRSCVVWPMSQPWRNNGPNKRWWQTFRQTSKASIYSSDKNDPASIGPCLSRSNDSGTRRCETSATAGDNGLTHFPSVTRSDSRASVIFFACRRDAAFYRKSVLLRWPHNNAINTMSRLQKRPPYVCIWCENEAWTSSASIHRIRIKSGVRDRVTNPREICIGLTLALPAMSDLNEQAIIHNTKCTNVA